MSVSKQRESNAISKSEGSSAGAGQSRTARKDEAKDKGVAKDKHATDRGVRKQRASDLGRALRSIYDDTLRESVPDDFNDLLGKLS